MAFRTRLSNVRLRHPEYTGENRCIPCTGVNVVMAGMIGIVGWFLHPLFGVAIALGSLLAIYFRGYLVPGTPTLTKRYFPERVLAWFEKDSERANPAVSDFELERFLLDRQIIEVCANEDDLCLVETVRDDIDATIDQYRDDPENLDRIARMFDTAPDSITSRDRTQPTYIVRGRRQRWPSTAAILSDTAINDVLATTIDDWADQPLARRLRVLEGLRPFHESCPECGGVLATDEAVVESCCRSKDVYQVHCTDCESVLFEIDAGAVEMV